MCGAPRLAAWIVRVPDLAAAIADAPWQAGRPVALARGDLRWRIALRADGTLPMAGAAPLLIEWQGAPHPAERMAPSGHCGLHRLAISLHPDPGPLAAWLRPASARPAPRVSGRGAPGLTARLVGPQGMVSLR
jgi:hypothetical protein